MSKLHRIPNVLLLIETSRAYGRGLVEGIIRYAGQHGPWAIRFEERGLADPLPSWLPQWRGDGILSRMTHASSRDRLLRLGPPVVELFADRKLKVGLVHPDDEAIGRAAAEHFLDRGIRHFGFFCTEADDWIRLRCQAFERVVAAHGYECLVFEYTGKKHAVKPQQLDDRSIVSWLKKLPKPCGVFCASDLFAMRLCQICRANSIIVPEQLAILGVDNDPVFCGTSSPPLSSIDVDSPRIGYEAAALLDRMMAGKAPPEQGVAIEPRQIVTRQSTDILAIDEPDIAASVRLIREQACRQLRVSQLAHAVGLSRRILERRFREVLHRTPKEEMLRVQMERARMLLSGSSMTIAQVAKSCGFGSLEYFCRAFRRHAGVPPRTYRTSQRIGGHG